MVVGRDLLVVLQPGDLWHGVARDVAGEIEGLVGAQQRHLHGESLMMTVIVRPQVQIVYLALLYSDHIR